MPRINNLPDDTTINDNDKLIGTERLQKVATHT
jgi:hypothetical protein